MVIDYAKEIARQGLDGGYENFKEQSYAVFTYAVNLYGFSAFPKVVSDEEFEKVNSPIQYRGATDAEFNANLLCDYDYHYGKGYFGYGIYSDPNRDTAHGYAHHVHDREKVIDSRIMKFKLEEDTRLYTDAFAEFNPSSIIDKINHPDIMYVRHLMKSVRPKEMRYFVDKLISDSTLALLLGYDGVHHTYYQTFNRGRMVVSESEFRRVCSLSRKYKDGTINFKKKYAKDEFLNE